MAEPMKKTSAAPGETRGPNAQRTSRVRPERDIGSRSKRPPRGQSRGRRQSSPEGRGESRPPRSGGQRQTRSGGSSPRRPRDVRAGAGARILAPLALVIFAIACFGVVANQSGDSSVNTSTEKSAARTGAAGGATVVKTTRSTYRVKAGDSFAVIAEKTGVSAEDLQTLNPDIDPRALQPGQKLKLK